MGSRLFKNGPGFYLFLLFLTLGGCNFVDIPPLATGFDATATGSDVQCEVDAEKLDKFAEVDVSKELTCIENKLELYAQVDQRQDPDVLDLNELTKFMQAFMKTPDDLEHGLTTLFTLHKLVFNGQEDRIPLTEISELFDFLRETNRLIIPVYSAFKFLDTDKDILESDFYVKRNEAIAGVNALSGYVTSVLNRYSVNRTQWVIDEILEAATSPKNQDFIEDIKAIKFAKSLILGGDQSILKFQEVLSLLQKAPLLAEVAFDVVGGYKTLFSQDTAYISLMREKSSLLWSTIYHQSGKDEKTGQEYNERYFHPDEMIEASTRFADFFLDLAPLRDSVYEVKKAPFLGDSDPYVTYKNAKALFGHLNTILHKLHYFQKMWELNEKVLTDSEPVDDSKIKDVPIESSPETGFNKEFKKILKTYRYFRGDVSVPLYDNPYSRNFRGMGEIAVFEYALKLFMQAYGLQKRDDKITEKDFLGIVLRYDDFVTEMKLWKNPVSGMVKTNYLMMDFFRNNSNSNGYLDLAEGVEYITMQLTSFHIADAFYPELEKDCLDSPDCLLSDFPGGVPTKFFYQNFFKHFIKWRAEFPNLYKYYLSLNEDQAYEYVRNMSKFARQCPYDYEAGENEIPIKKRDLILITGGIVSLEETFLVLDLDRDNFLSYDELEIAVNRFEDAIVEFAQLDKGTRFLARTIFYYLVLKQKLPTPTEALLYHVNFNLFVNKKKIAADRGAIAGLLKNFTTPPPEPDPDCYTDKPVPR